MEKKAGKKKDRMKEEKEKNEKTEKEGLTRRLPFMLQRTSSLPKKVKSYQPWVGRADQWMGRSVKRAVESCVEEVGGCIRRVSFGLWWQGGVARFPINTSLNKIYIHGFLFFFLKGGVIQKHSLTCWNSFEWFKTLCGVWLLQVISPSRLRGATFEKGWNDLFWVIWVIEILESNCLPLNFALSCKCYTAGDDTGYHQQEQRE